MRRLVRAALVLCLAAAAAVWWIGERIRTPYRGFSDAGVFVDLPPGSGLSAITSALASAGIVPDKWTFEIAVRWTGTGRRLEAGEYQFTAAATPLEVVSRLSRGDVYKHPVTFPEGLTVHEIAAIFDRSGLGTAAEFEAAAGEGSLIASLDPGAPTLEGYLFPDTYAFGRHVGAEGAVRAMVARFVQRYGAHIDAGAAALHESPREIVTLASLVEKETAAPGERPTIAAVYWNRLRIGMPLQCDPTVIFALMQAHRWNGNLTRENLQIDSPYNTYRYRGLPPGPIASPGLAALDAAIHPAAVPYLYFVSRNDGTHAFASTLAEHDRNVNQWQVRFFRDKNRAARQNPH
jgi:UPF0755 protein